MSPHIHTYAARLEIAVDVARGLTYLHGQTEDGQRHSPPVYHRDVKSANIGLSLDFRTAKLLDYGLAKAMEARPGGQTTALGLQTLTGGIVGTPAYMSVEALEGRYGAQSEVYSFGVVLFELVTGRLASAGTKEEIEDATDDGRDYKGLKARLDPAAGAWPEDVVDPLLALTNSCCRRRPINRPKTMREVLMVLMQLRDSLLPLPPIAPAVPAAPERLEELDDQIRALMQRREALQAQVGAERPPAAPPRPGAPTRVCCVCFDESPESEGIYCRLEDGPHFVCHEDLQGYVGAEVDGDRLQIHRGAIPCPGRDAGNRPCTSSAWEVAHLQPHLQPQTQVKAVCFRI